MTSIFSNNLILNELNKQMQFTNDFVYPMLQRANMVMILLCGLILVLIAVNQFCKKLQIVTAVNAILGLVAIICTIGFIYSNSQNLNKFDTTQQVFQLNSAKLATNLEAKQIANSTDNYQILIKNQKQLVNVGSIHDSQFHAAPTSAGNALFKLNAYVIKHNLQKHFTNVLIFNIDAPTVKTPAGTIYTLKGNDLLLILDTNNHISVIKRNFK